MGFLNTFKFVLMMFTNPWVLIPAICIGIFSLIMMTISSKREAVRDRRVRDPLDWIDDDFSL